MNFGELSAEFLEIVNTKGEGWYYRHIQNIIKLVKKNPVQLRMRKILAKEMKKTVTKNVKSVIMSQIHKEYKEC